MRAIYFDKFQGPLSLEEVSLPPLKDHQVEIKVIATGLCRSDWHAWMGHDTDIVLPHVPGHEFAGVIARVGKTVNRFQIGDRVTVPFVCGCGTCSFCLSGNAQVCPNQTQPGFTHFGSFAEFVQIDHADFNVIMLPNEMDFESAASLGCRFATSFRGLTERAKVRQGETVVVFGCGGVGLSAIMIAKALEANVIAVDVSESALAKAAELGADVTLNSNEIDVVAEIVKITDGGAHVGIDALGSEATASNSILSLRRLGRHLQLGLLPSESGKTNLPMVRAIAYELSLLGSHGMAAVHYPKMLEMVASGKLAPQKLITERITLDEGVAALTHFATRSSAGITIIKS